MEYFIVGIFAFVVGWKLGMEVHARIFAKMLEELGITEKDLDQLLKKAQGEESEASQEEIEEELLEEIPVKIEQHQGQLYAFRVDNDAFLGQGVDRESLIKRLTETMNGVRLTISEENGSRYIKEAR